MTVLRAEYVTHIVIVSSTHWDFFFFLKANFIARNFIFHVKYFHCFTALFRSMLHQLHVAHER